MNRAGIHRSKPWKPFQFPISLGKIIPASRALIQVINIFMEGQILLYFFGTHFEQQQDPNSGEWFPVSERRVG
jgi:hypothetical protein